ncbi:class I SAM-dependent methyltransferase [Salinarchaeum sp. Harcht-Bsk1]|uniref:class I SAM-dependent methyltransferase n=1 Tax=Salinarchaeum sp. Harcht-Bsk1 TaxID=1333523 RepID=UPI0006776A8F|nr:class I SAM-dependent methyltransferase [Salinarchaeum sp. Harcht-Bsk1]
MREFSAEYLTNTRRGMWADSRATLADLSLAERDRVLDVGCGTGELTRVLAEETTGEVYGVDADPALLTVAREYSPVVAGDALQLPFADDAMDLVVCQALLINLPDPAAAVEEFARVASDAVAAIEPDNSDVTVESSVEQEATLTAEARAAYRRGVPTDVALGGAGTRAAFEDAGLADVRTTRYDHVRTIEPPYAEADLEAVRRTASGAGLAGDRETLLAGGLSEAAYDDLRERWRAVGRAAIEQVRDDRYRRREVVPFYVTVGTVPPGADR